jgi:hypothetical protein
VAAPQPLHESNLEDGVFNKEGMLAKKKNDKLSIIFDSK